jgi:hypothetical protein
MMSKPVTLVATSPARNASTHVKPEMSN